jgi:hypothetical protein
MSTAVGLFADGNRYCDDYNKGTSTGIQSCIPR